MHLTSTRRRTTAFTCAVLILALGLTACGGGDKKHSKPDKTQSTGTSRDSGTLVQASPITGLPAKSGLPKHRVFVVKIENTANGAPQTGLKQADLVYEELVEGGLTRLGAFFYSKTPDHVGHVRSARATDIDMVKPTGGLLIASGAASRTVSRIHSGKVTFLSEDTSNLSLQKDPNKLAPYNRLIDLSSLAKTHGAKQKAKPPAPFLPFGAASTFKGGAPAKSFSVAFSRDSATKWDFSHGVYTRANGHAAKGEDFRATSVLVLKTRQGNAGYLDPAGNPVPETLLTGKGAAKLFYGGKYVDAVWHKKSSSAPFTLTTKAGQKMSVPAGRTWLELIPNDRGGVTVAK